MANSQIATLGGGCFWCLDAAYRQIKGIQRSVSGFAGGHTKNPTYEEVQTQTTGHAEVVQLTFDPAIISYQDILEIFWVIHDPTSVNRQGNDVGEGYRSVIFYVTDEQKKTAEASRERAAQQWDKPIVTEIVPLDEFYPADEAHQNFFAKNPDIAYCQVIINPKLQKLQAKFASLLKD